MATKAQRIKLFTVEDAYRAHRDGDPIYISRRQAEWLILRHRGEPVWSFDRDVGVRASYDAWDVLAWLGY